MNVCAQARDGTARWGCIIHERPAKVLGDALIYSTICTHACTKSDGAAGIFEYGSKPHDEATVDAFLDWGINAVRVPLNQDCWLGDVAQTGGGGFVEANVGENCKRAFALLECRPLPAAPGRQPFFWPARPAG